MKHSINDTYPDETIYKIAVLSDKEDEKVKKFLKENKSELIRENKEENKIKQISIVSSSIKLFCPECNEELEPKINSDPNDNKNLCLYFAIAFSRYKTQYF